MSKNRKVSNTKFSASWTEKDEALFYDLVKRKISDLNYELKEATSPFIRSRLKAKKREYQSLLKKIEAGNYDSNILSAEMAAHNANMINRHNAMHSKFKSSKYVDSYSEMKFDFTSYFRGARYFGSALPILLLIITVAVVFIMSFSIIMARTNVDSMDDTLQAAMPDTRLSLAAIGYMKLSPDKDFYVPNDGNWPRAYYLNPENALNYGQLYVDENGDNPSYVWLHSQLGIEAIDITTLDVLKAFFYTPLMQRYEISQLEAFLFPTEVDQITWYYRYYISGREEMVSLQRNEAGDYETLNVVNSIGTYGTIFAFILALVLCIMQAAVCVLRLFTYTSRRFHFLPFLIALMLVLTLIFPVMAITTDASFSGLSNAVQSFFNLNFISFIEGEAVGCVNFVYVLSIALMLIALILPLLFKNRAIKRVTYVPKGNRPHTYEGHKYPTKPGGIPNGYYNPKYLAAKKK